MDNVHNCDKQKTNKLRGLIPRANYTDSYINIPSSQIYR
jgi:hypothetical protein